MPTLIEKFTDGTLPIESYPKLAQEVRTRILETVGRNGGHLASNLGVVELTIALLTIFKPDRDRILFDVSHQCYTWKILTGRESSFPTLRKKGGISGFLKREESVCDAFNAGHAGTAISAALGMAAARDEKGSDENIVAVVGDASLANGISLEALNNVASTTKRLIVILNDNEMSISHNVGALSRYFGKILSSHRYNKVKNKIETFAEHLRLHPLRGAYHKLESSIKSLIVPNGFFEDLGLRYVGPIDGHDFKSLLSALAIARDYDHPIVLHIATKKGHGYAPAEDKPMNWHGVPPFDVTQGILPPPKPGYSAAFGKALTELATKDNRIVAITAAMRGGTGLDAFAEKFPQRLFDVGICEEHAATFAAGLSAAGMRPFVALYSTFAQRAVDSIFHDVCLQNLPVTFCLDRAGIVGADGPTHHGLFDIALLRPFPNIVIMQPRNETVLAAMLATALGRSAPCVIRYPRGGGNDSDIRSSCTPLEIGKAEILKEPSIQSAKIVWIWALGDMINTAIKTADILEARGIGTGVVDARFIKPLDTSLLRAQATSNAIIATLENGVVNGGFGTAVLEALSESGNCARVHRFGWPDMIIPHGTSMELFNEFKLDAESISKVLTVDADICIQEPQRQ